MSPDQDAEIAAPKLFLPSWRAGTLLGALGVVALSAALYLRYAIIQNSTIGVACEAGEVSVLCQLRLGVISMFAQDCFGWVGMIAACIQLWRPNIVVFGTGLIFALMGLVLYNTRASALAIALLVLSLARPSPAKR